MPERLKQLLVDQLHVNAPWGGSFAAIELADLKDIVAIVTMIGGLLCSIYVAYHKTRKDQ